MRDHLPLPLIATVASLAFAASLHAQQEKSRPAAAAPSAPKPATALPTPSNKRVSIVPVYLDRAAVNRAADAMPADKKSKGPGFLKSLKKTVEGDKNVIEAAKKVLEARAPSVDSSGNSTVVVVIGGEAELNQVVESLSRVERPVRIAYVDKTFEDDNYDNTALASGLIGGVKDAADNMWIYLPRGKSAPRTKPNKVISVRVATPTFWNGLFASTGDAIDVDQLKSLAAKSDAPKADTAIATSSASASEAFVPGAGSPFAIGDVVTPKIANVKVLADASANSKVLGTVSKSDELVVAGAPKNGFVMVEGASSKGWISVNLLMKH
ncbi:MAG TPA: hypothetical protein VGQ52_12855 [Gemmatimonadaceae bacterium]|nr:hypothetical protein [Gemmatimonadaceae bacterium]